MLYKDTPYAGYCIALIAGIILGSFMNSVLYSNIAFIIFTVILVFNISLYGNRRSSVFFGLFIHCSIFCIGCSLSIIQKNKLQYIEPGVHLFIVKTDNYPSPAKRSLKINSSLLKIDGKDGYKNNKLVLYTDDRFVSDSLKPGSIISFISQASEITDFDSSDNFDYRTFMNNRGFRYSTFCYDSILVIDEKPGIKHLALRFRKVLQAKLANTMTDKKSLAIVSAMTLGYRDMVDDEIKEEFRKSGIIHIMAVSGLHVGIVSLIIISLLRIVRIKTGLASLIISLIIIWTYAFITGLSPSVTRASVMFSFLNTGYFIYRPVKPLNSVMASAFLILIINPSMIYEASFLLSYSAVISIVSNYSKLLAKANLRGRFLSSIWKILTVSILAQAGTIPFVALFFDEIPLFSLFSNLFAIPLATIILIMGFALILLGGLPLIPGILNNIINFSVTTLSDSAASIASLEKAVISVSDISAPRAIVLFLLLMVLIRFLLDSEKNNPHILLTCIVLYFIIP